MPTAGVAIRNSYVDCSCLAGGRARSGLRQAPPPAATKHLKGYTTVAVICFIGSLAIFLSQAIFRTLSNYDFGRIEYACWFNI